MVINERFQRMDDIWNDNLYSIVGDPATDYLVAGSPASVNPSEG